jgi:hypothetical protein
MYFIIFSHIYHWAEVLVESRNLHLRDEKLLKFGGEGFAVQKRKLIATSQGRHASHHSGWGGLPLGACRYQMPDFNRRVLYQQK